MSNCCFRTIVSLIVAALVLPLAFGQTPSAAGNGDVFNATTINNDCEQVFLQSEQKINADELQIEARSSRDQAACKIDELSACETKPVLSRSAGPTQGTAMTPSLDPSAPSKGGSNTAAPGTAVAPRLDPSADQPAPDPQGTPPGTKGLTRTPGPCTPTPGTKGLTRTPGPCTPTPSTSDTPAPPNVPAIDKAMSDCLSKKLPYLVQQTVSPEFLQLALSSAPASARAVPFAQLPGESQVFLEETAMGLQAQVAHDSKYGSNKYNAADSSDYMVGWLDDCLFVAGIQQDYTNQTTDDPRVAYARFLGVPLSDQRLFMFNYGYPDGSLPPLPLMPPPAPSPNPGLLPLKPSPTSGTFP